MSKPKRTCSEIHDEIVNKLQPLINWDIVNEITTLLFEYDTAARVEFRDYVIKKSGGIIPIPDGPTKDEG